MSYIRIVYLYCDGPKETCPLEGRAYRVSERPDTTVADHRRLAKFDGWLHHKGKDYCPDCRAAVAKKGD